ncbi:MAG: indole-3-glycerol phosphate synthase TrpC [Candidatus Latescibacteria bacterium]|nr:indole-3-glycerol phosphate synthase TrpC [Candidatus Latescibacterota bacterium]
MNGILGEIVEYKREFVKGSKQKLPLKELDSRISDTEQTRGFAQALQGDGCALIAEIKTASPSKGIIRDGVEIDEIAKIYEKNGASCISVLTDEKYFKGNLERLTKIKKVTSIPLLRKDFIIDEYQIYEARYAGADAVLLITACLDDVMMREFMEIAALLGLDCLIEVHDMEEMNRIQNFNIKLVGINNRDLKTFKTDLSTTGQLAEFAPEQALLVSESGINSSEDVKTVYNMGADAVLVGEAIMREQNMAAKVYELSNAIK